MTLTQERADELRARHEPRCMYKDHKCIVFMHEKRWYALAQDGLEAFEVEIGSSKLDKEIA